MKSIARMTQCFVCAAWLLAAYGVSAADARTYQVTGPVLEVTPTTITVQKGSEKWQINRDTSTKVTGDVKVGSRVTITYTMTAAEITVKSGKGSSEKK